MSHKNNSYISEKYLECRQKALSYTNEDMNLILNDDNQVYLAVIDMPVKSIIRGIETRTLILVFGLSTQIYQSDGLIITGLEENKDVFKAMNSFFISVPQVLDKMDLCLNTEYCKSSNFKVYLKTRRGTFFKELYESREDKFLKMLIENILSKI